jgi:hypothetical protein
MRGLKIMRLLMMRQWVMRRRMSLLTSFKLNENLEVTQGMKGTSTQP